MAAPPFDVTVQAQANPKLVLDVQDTSANFGTNVVMEQDSATIPIHVQVRSNTLYDLGYSTDGYIKWGGGGPLERSNINQVSYSGTAFGTGGGNVLQDNHDRGTTTFTYDYLMHLTDYSIPADTDLNATVTYSTAAQ